MPQWTSRDVVSPNKGFFYELFPPLACLTSNDNGSPRQLPTVSGRNNFKGFANDDVLTADIQLHTEQYDAVCRTGEPRCSTTLASPNSAIVCWSYGEYRFTQRRNLVSPAHVTLALSLRKPSKARCHTKDTGLFRLLQTKRVTPC
jgi:hypothetical protein